MEKQELTWKDVLRTVDGALETLANLMNANPRQGVYYQQRMAVMMLRRQEVLAHIAEEETRQ